jgi:hypothetical protein
MKKIFGLVISGLLASVGCGGNSVSQKDLPTELVNTVCAKSVKCGEFVSLTECKRFYTAFGFFDQIIKTIELGKASYDPDKMGECLDAFSSQTCDSTSKSNREQPQACRDAIKGKTTTGGACTDDSQCASSNCRVTAQPMACAAGTCDGEPGAVGASCAMAACNPGLFCESASKTCKTYLAAGASCMNNDECDYGLSCLGEVQTCKAPPKTGEACPDGECALSGDYCNATSNTCVSNAKQGEACDPLSNNCIGPLLCDQTSKTCVPLPAIGAACAGACDIGAFCNRTSKLCEAAKADGATCTNGAECNSNNCVRPSGSITGTCTAKALCL